MSKMIADDPVLRKRLDEAGQRARDQELKIIILEKEVELLKAGKNSPKSDFMMNEKFPGDDEAKLTKETESSEKLTPPKTGSRDETCRKSKDTKHQPTTESRHSHSTMMLNQSSGSGAEARAAGDRSAPHSIPQLNRRTK
jgi:hypothetical protein